ncbi:MAG: hypothetical protein EAX81_05910 [Candidatus Thorarchaeota archaeon]|nr:hypothetical protein [Candidatus Thorarchaeota archaeon]
MISGWGFFGSWIGIWFAPQERFTIPLFEQVLVVIPILQLTAISTPIVHLMLSLLFLLPGVWLGIAGVRKTDLKMV